MKKTLILVLILIILGLFLIVLPSISGFMFNKRVKSVACSMEAKLCSDGSAVGRSGPNCEFSECPKIIEATSTPVDSFKEGNIVLSIGQEGKIGNLSIKVNKVTEDSRCPTDVVCIWAGSVTANTILKDQTHSEIINISSAKEAHIFGDYTLYVSSVTPAHKSTEKILASEYKITLHVSLSKQTIVKNLATVSGSVTLSPTCPVERMPPDPACAPKPYATTIKILSSDKKRTVKTVQSKSDGKFNFSIPWGEYKIQGGGGNPYPRCGEIVLSLKSVEAVTVNISCDTGIR